MSSFQLRRHLELLRDKIRAALGDTFACHQLGARYATGDHGEWPELRSARTALRWYARGARRRDPDCLYDLGFMYLLGEGTAQDPLYGVTLLEQAAAQEYGEAIRLLADLFARGEHGVVADPIRAEHWAGALSAHLARHPEDRRSYER